MTWDLPVVFAGYSSSCEANKQGTLESCKVTWDLPVVYCESFTIGLPVLMGLLINFKIQQPGNRKDMYITLKDR